MDIAQLTRKILDRREQQGDPLRIVQAGHPALRRRAAPARGVLEGALLVELLEAMTVTMRRAPGVGLAAPQIGLPLALFVLEDRVESAEDDSESTGVAGDRDVVDASDPLERAPVPLRALLDPEVVPLGGERVFAWEGCLSVDGWQSIVPRARRVGLRATEVTADGELREIQEEHRGWPARILQHETDHLHGTLCHDVAVPRSFIDAAYGPHYADLPDAVRRLGLSGDVTRLEAGQVVLPDPAAGPARGTGTGGVEQLPG